MITLTEIIKNFATDLVLNSTDDYAIRAVRYCRMFERLVYKRLGNIPSHVYRDFYSVLVDFLYRQEDSTPLLNLNSHDKEVLRRNLDSAAEFLSYSSISEISSRF